LQQTSICSRTHKAINNIGLENCEGNVTNPKIFRALYEDCPDTVSGESTECEYGALE